MPHAIGEIKLGAMLSGELSLGDNDVVSQKRSFKERLH